ncbi:hypothetical protein TSUD_320820 [Trifolium subterraneum]|uniref:Reverse transcriptase zinc-binding domain-containing protein n=1 Tax=Trifolium subterraneum TaxID=3900 RepID=A0A2Z6P8Z1_TRISU|nr:hypothetical protein TSUD_320820 [Trifolium subterraneum]
MFLLGWGAGGEAWEEEMLGNVGLYFLLSHCRLTLQIDDYGIQIWMADILFAVPLKVSILAWRLLRDRLPTKANMISRGILPVEDHHCVFGCGAVDSAQHVFLSCSTFRSLWSLVSSWIGSSLVTAQTLSDHFVQFTTSAGGIRAHRSFMQLIWLACVWVVRTTKPQIVQRLNKLFTSYVEQDQDFSQLVVKSKE